MTWLGRLPAGLPSTSGVADAAVSVCPVGEHVRLGGFGFVAGHHVLAAAFAVVRGHEPWVMLGGRQGDTSDGGELLRGVSVAPAVHAGLDNVGGWCDTRAVEGASAGERLFRAVHQEGAVVAHGDGRGEGFGGIRSGVSEFGVLFTWGSHTIRLSHYATLSTI